MENNLLNKIVNQNVDHLLSFDDELSSIEINELVNRTAIQTTTRDGQRIKVEDKLFFGSSQLKMSGRVYIKNGLALGVISYK